MVEVEVMFTEGPMAAVVVAFQTIVPVLQPSKQRLSLSKSLSPSFISICLPFHHHSLSNSHTNLTRINLPSPCIIYNPYSSLSADRTQLALHNKSRSSGWNIAVNTVLQSSTRPESEALPENHTVVDMPVGETTRTMGVIPRKPILKPKKSEPAMSSTVSPLVVAEAKPSSQEPAIDVHNIPSIDHMVHFTLSVAEPVGDTETPHRTRPGREASRQQEATETDITTGDATADERLAAIWGSHHPSHEVPNISVAVPVNLGPYKNGIQVPSRSLITGGFPYPSALEFYGISDKDWETFTKSILAYINPHRAWWKTAILANLVWPVGEGGTRPIKGAAERHDFQKSLSQIFGRVREFEHEVFRPKGLLMRLDVPGDDTGMKYMDLYHEKHVDHLPRILHHEDNLDYADNADGAVITPDRAEAESPVVGQVGQSQRGDKHTKKGSKKDKNAEKQRKKHERYKKLGNEKPLGHLHQAYEDMAKRPRIVIESARVLENPDKAERNGWCAWIRHCERYRLGRALASDDSQPREVTNQCDDNNSSCADTETPDAPDAPVDTDLASDPNFPRENPSGHCHGEMPSCQGKTQQCHHCYMEILPHQGDKPLCHHCHKGILPLQGETHLCHRWPGERSTYQKEIISRGERSLQHRASTTRFTIDLVNGGNP